MTLTHPGRGGKVVGMICGLVLLEAVTFFLGALLHAGVRLPLGFAVVAEPRIFPAVIVEGLCGLFLAIGAYAVYARATRAWPVVVTAHVFAVAGVLLGIVALAVGAGPSTELNHVYHRAIIVILVAALLLLLSPTVKEALGGGDRVSRRA